MPDHPAAADLLRATLARRIVILDGAMGTMIQRLGLTEADYRGARFADHPRDLRGDNDLLVLTKPEAIEAFKQATLLIRLLSTQALIRRQLTENGLPMTNGQIPPPPS